jgi:hypothetical protein
MIAIAVALAMVASVSASSQSLLFGGAFAVGDPYCIYCPDTNPLSPMGMSCHCPAGFRAYPEAPIVESAWNLKAASADPLMRVGSTCGVDNSQWRASLSFCIAEPESYNHTSIRFRAPSVHANDQFAGVYQTVNGICSVTNPLTGACSCPIDRSLSLPPSLLSSCFPGSWLNADRSSSRGWL